MTKHLQAYENDLNTIITTFQNIWNNMVQGYEAEMTDDDYPDIWGQVDANYDYEFFVKFERLHIWNLEMPPFDILRVLHLDFQEPHPEYEDTWRSFDPADRQSMHEDTKVVAVQRHTRTLEVASTTMFKSTRKPTDIEARHYDMWCKGWEPQKYEDFKEKDFDPFRGRPHSRGSPSEYPRVNRFGETWKQV